MDKKPFVRNPWSENMDSIRVDALVRRVEDEAHPGCGLHYEIYHKRIVDKLQNLMFSLNETEAKLLEIEAAQRGYHLDEDSIIESDLAYKKLFNSLREDV